MRWWIVGMAMGLAACGGQATPPGRERPQSLAIRDFDAIVLDSSDSVDVRRGDNYAVRIEGPAGIEDRLDIRRDGNALRIGRKEGGLWSIDRTSARILVTMPAIRTATVTGSGDIAIDQAGDPFAATLAGSGDMTIGQLHGERATLTVSGSGTIAAAGAVRALALALAGSGRIDATQTRASEATVSITGSGDVAATVDGPARVSLTGSGSATLGPGARCTVNRIGSGTAHCG